MANYNFVARFWASLITGSVKKEGSMAEMYAACMLEQHGNMWFGGLAGGHGDYGQPEAFDVFFEKEWNNKGSIPFKDGFVDRAKLILKNQLLRPCFEEANLIQDGHYTTAGRPFAWKPSVPEDQPNGPITFEGVTITGQDRQHYPVNWLYSLYRTAKARRLAIEKQAITEGWDTEKTNKAINASIGPDLVFNRVMDAQLVPFNIEQLSAILLIILAQRVVGILRGYWFAPKELQKPDGSNFKWYAPIPNKIPEAMRAEAKMIHAVINGFSTGGLPNQEIEDFYQYLDKILLPFHERIAPGFQIQQIDTTVLPNTAYSPPLMPGNQFVWTIEWGVYCNALDRLYKTLISSSDSRWQELNKRLKLIRDRYIRQAVELTTDEGWFPSQISIPGAFPNSVVESFDALPILRHYPIYSSGPSYFGYSRWAYYALAVAAQENLHPKAAHRRDVVLANWRASSPAWSYLGFDDHSWMVEPIGPSEYGVKHLSK